MHDLGFFNNICALSTYHVVDAEIYTVNFIVYKTNEGEMRVNYYAFDVERGGLDTFCKLQFFTLSMQRMRIFDVSNGKFINVNSPKVVCRYGRCHLRLAAADSHVSLDSIHNVFRSKPGFFIYLGRVVDHPSFNAAKYWFL